MGGETPHTIVLASCADTLLAVMGTLQCRHIRVRVDCTKEYGFVLAKRFSIDSDSAIEVGTHLVHTSICK